MLKLWRLAHFKSVVNETTLELAPLTVFAGANSSGKSTVIQSILLTAQTLQSPVSTRTVVLNGHITRLGAFRDIVSNTDAQGSILIGFELDTRGAADRSFVGPVGRNYYRRYFRPDLPQFPATISCHYRFSAAGSSGDSELRQLQPVLDESYIRADSSASGRVTTTDFLVRRSTEALESRAARLSLPSDKRSTVLQSLLSFEVIRQQSELLEEPFAQTLDDRAIGASFIHFLPESVAIRYDPVEAESRQILSLLTATTTTALRDPALQGDYEIRINAETARILVDSLRTVLNARGQTSLYQYRYAPQLDQFEREPALHNLIQILRPMQPPDRLALAQRIGQIETQVREAIRGSRRGQFAVRQQALPSLVGYSVDAIQDYFTNSLLYLGPLRDEPKPVYPLTGGTDPRDVGFRGEHTAAVLDVNRNTLVQYIPTEGFVDESAPPRAVRRRLEDAVRDWLGYMGMATNVQTEDRGKLGHELRIATSDGRALHDLTQVGVGVSQVLPILVLSLLAPTGSTLIFEQPELHLHPRVQTRLADFLVSLTQVSKQCIVETHSDALINRLRYRAVLAKGRELADTVILYFVEKDNDQSVYRQIRINEFGTIDDWPVGFFDESEAAAAEILRAGLAKRRKREPGANA